MDANYTENVTHRTLAALLDDLDRRTQPTLTWYGNDRVELSGPVLSRWIAKSENLLQDEFPFGLESFKIDLPLSWRAFPWFVCMTFRGTEESDIPELLITDSPATSTADTTIAQPLDSLALSWPGTLPPGALDGARDVMSQSDRLVAPPDDSLFVAEGNPGRILIWNENPEEVYADALSALLSGGSVVVVDPSYHGEDNVARIRAQERL